MINQIKISDFQAPELDIYARTKEVVLLNRARPEEGIFIAESPKVIERALDSGCEPISISNGRTSYRRRRKACIGAV